jgi:hypothetical protein
MRLAAALPDFNSDFDAGNALQIANTFANTVLIVVRLQ